MSSSDRLADTSPNTEHARIVERMEYCLRDLRAMNQPGSDVRNRQLSLGITDLENAILRVTISANPYPGWE